MQAKTITSPISNPEEFFLEVPLYRSFGITAESFAEVFQIEFFQGTLDTYCIECQERSTFRSMASLPKVGAASQDKYPQSVNDLVKNYASAWLPTEGNDWSLSLSDLSVYALKNREFFIDFACTRVTEHHMHFIFCIKNNRIIKIGQYPSLADLQSSEIKKYRRVLGNGKYCEFNRAIGLSAHGVGIGSFVYLRRIFEDLIEKAHIEAATTPDWDEAKFGQARMDEKILMLQDLLPAYLIENSGIYSILSKGLHSLNEEECLEYFAVIKLGIELILDEKIEKEEKAKKISQTTQTIAAIKGKLSQ